MASHTLEDRVAALEDELTRLKQFVKRKNPAGWQSVVGTFLNDPYFEQAMKEGRRYRESLRPRGQKKKRKA